MRRGHQSS
jgi:hypothetical protein